MVAPAAAHLARAVLLPAGVGTACASLPGHARAQPAEAGAVRRPWPAGKAVPAVQLPVWEGSAPWSLAAQRGQVVLVNFWASWCEPCRAEMPSLELLAQRHERDRVQVVAVNFRETDAVIRRFVDQTGLGLPVLRDADGNMARAFGVRIFPSTVVFGRDGRPVFTVTGEVDWTGATARAWMAALV
jgi:thiol-disulfide isomerase/thioredoxin